MDPRIIEKRKLQKEKRKRERLRAIQWIIRLALFGVILYTMLNALVFTIISVDGDSMYPTFSNRDRLAFSRINIKENRLQRGDIILFKGNDGRSYIKRIIGLPGEFVEINNGVVYINGREYKQDVSRAYTYVYNNDKWYLKSGQFFVLGDNRDQDDSKDSRIFGPIDIKDIKGKYLLGL